LDCKLKGLFTHVHEQCRSFDKISPRLKDFLVQLEFFLGVCADSNGVNTGSNTADSVLSEALALRESFNGVLADEIEVSSLVPICHSVNLVEVCSELFISLILVDTMGLGIVSILEIEIEIVVNL
jgi:hypothetical protein